MTDITTNNGHQHARMPVAEPWPELPASREQSGVRDIIEEIQNAYDRQCRELDSRDNLIELLRDELARKNELIEQKDEKIESYIRKTYEMAQQMKAVAQLCEEGRRLADIVDRG